MLSLSILLLIQAIDFLLTMDVFPYEFPWTTGWLGFFLGKDLTFGEEILGILGIGIDLDALRREVGIEVEHRALWLAKILAADNGMTLRQGFANAREVSVGHAVLHQG